MATPYDTIDSVFVKQYADTYVALLEQKESKLLSTITNIGSVTGTGFTVNEFGGVEGEFGAVTRFGETKYNDASFASRYAVMSDFSNFTRQAIQDLYKLKADPSDQLLKSLHARYNRKVDSVIYNAMIGSAQRKTTEADTFSPVTLPASQIIGDGTEALTLKQLIDVKTKFMENECDEDIYLVYNHDVLNQVLADPTLTSADYLAGQMLQRGEINDFLGFKWVQYNGIKDNASGIVTGVAYTRSALQYASNTISPLKIVEVETQNRFHSIGHIDAQAAIRTDEKRVVAFKFKA